MVITRWLAPTDPAGTQRGGERGGTSCLIQRERRKDKETAAVAALRPRATMPTIV